jgi:hypothetical protein
MPNDDPVENKFDVLVEAIKKLVRLFSLEAGERQHDKPGGSRKLSAVASVHSIALNIFGIISVQVLQA